MNNINRWAQEKYWRTSLLGSFYIVIVCLATNLLIVPHNLYAAGSTGLAQLLRSLLIRFTPLEMGSHDPAGIINFVISAPLGYLVWRRVGGRIITQSLILLLVHAIATSLIPIPQEPPIKDPLLAAIFAGVIAGFAQGKIMSCGCCSPGGANYAGLLLAQKHPNIKVGRVGMTISAVVYGVSAILYDLNVAAVSMVFCFLLLYMQDRFHNQTKNCGVFLFCKADPEILVRYIVEELQRDATHWQATGGYTHEPTTVLYVVLSKAELIRLEQFIQEQNLQSFITVQEDLRIDGRYAQHL